MSVYGTILQERYIVNIITKIKTNKNNLRDRPIRSIPFSNS